MTIDTLGKAWAAGWTGHMRCSHVSRAGTEISHQCGAHMPLDMGTLVAARGFNYPLDAIPSRLMCPNCKTVGVHVLFSQPEKPTRNTLRTLTSETLDAGNARAIEHAKATYGTTFTVCEFQHGSNQIVAQIAICHHLTVAYYAYDGARKQYPDRRFLLRHGAYVIRDSDDPDREDAGFVVNS